MKYKSRCVIRLMPIHHTVGAALLYTEKVRLLVRRMH